MRKLNSLFQASLMSLCLLSAAVGQGQDLRSPASDGQPVNCKSDQRRSLRQDLLKIPANSTVKVAFFDADSTLRISKIGSVSANTRDDVRLLPNVGRALSNLARNGYLIYIVSNQNGVGSGIISCEIAEGALLYTIHEIFKVGGVVHGFDYAENADEYYRKPGTGMADELEKTLKRLYGRETTIDKKQSIMIGDSAFKKAKGDAESDWRWDAQSLTLVPGSHHSNADRLFAQAIGVHFIEATDFFGWRKYGIDVIGSQKELDLFLEKCSDCTP